MASRRARTTWHWRKSGQSLPRQFSRDDVTSGAANVDIQRAHAGRRKVAGLQRAYGRLRHTGLQRDRRMLLPFVGDAETARGRQDRKFAHVIGKHAMKAQIAAEFAEAIGEIRVVHQRQIHPVKPAARAGKALVDGATLVIQGRRWIR